MPLACECDLQFMLLHTGALLINTSSSHLIDDGSLKRALINGAVGGVALDGVEGPEWLEAWVSWFMILEHAGLFTYAAFRLTSLLGL
jgi:lactate dehydrogenase-like 2-hydroxyacid dehydrogenase